MDEELEKRIFPTRRFDHLTLEGQKLENKGMGFIRPGRTIRPGRPTIGN